jgi:hypothetical protein
LSFGNAAEKLPKWFNAYPWESIIKYYPSAFLPIGLGLIERDLLNFKVKISDPARAFLECLYLAPKEMALWSVMNCWKERTTCAPLPCKITGRMYFCKGKKIVPVHSKADHSCISF